MAMNLALEKTSSMGAGFRYSPYGTPCSPGVAYWTRVGAEMASRFVHATPEAIWIVSTLEGQATHLTFPGSAVAKDISFAGEDENEAALEQFDRLGFRVWLQVEPGDADVKTLIDLILARYAHHPCITGLGVDVEWHHSTEKPEGSPVDDVEAASWLSSILEHGAEYRLFLKHWEVTRLPKTLRDGILFVDDSQMFSSPQAMLAEFIEWGEHFYPAPVAFQIGYPADKKWWAKMDDPAKEIGRMIVNAIPNTAGIYWVNFSALEVFPP